MQLVPFMFDDMIVCDDGISYIENRFTSSLINISDVNLNSIFGVVCGVCHIVLSVKAADMMVLKNGMEQLNSKWILESAIYLNASRVWVQAKSQ